MDTPGGEGSQTSAFLSTACLRLNQRRYSIAKMTVRRTILLAMMLVAGLCFAQFRPRSGENPRPDGPGHFVRIEGGLVVNEDEIRTARETASHSSGTPDWTNAPGF